MAGKRLALLAKSLFFSFSRDKIISSIYGGMVATNDDNLASALQQIRADLKYPSYYWIFQQLLHPILLHYVILPVYNFLDLGKIFLVLSQWFHILSKAVSWQEKQGRLPDYFPKVLPNALAIMALNQFNKLKKYCDETYANHPTNYQKIISDFMKPFIKSAKNSIIFGKPDKK